MLLRDRIGGCDMLTLHEILFESLLGKRLANCAEEHVAIAIDAEEKSLQFRVVELLSERDRRRKKLSQLTDMTPAQIEQYNQRYARPAYFPFGPSEDDVRLADRIAKQSEVLRDKADKSLNVSLDVRHTLNNIARRLRTEAKDLRSRLGKKATRSIESPPHALAVFTLNKSLQAIEASLASEMHQSRFHKEVRIALPELFKMLQEVEEEVCQTKE